MPYEILPDRVLIRSIFQFLLHPPKFLSSSHSPERGSFLAANVSGFTGLIATSNTQTVHSLCNIGTDPVLTIPTRNFVFTQGFTEVPQGLGKKYECLVIHQTPRVFYMSYIANSPARLVQYFVRHFVWILHGPKESPKSQNFRFFYISDPFCRLISWF